MCPVSFVALEDARYRHIGVARCVRCTLFGVAFFGASTIIRNLCTDISTGGVFQWANG